MAESQQASLLQLLKELAWHLMTMIMLKHQVSILQGGELHQKRAKVCGVAEKGLWKPHMY